jgi:hypothetical protein
MIPVFDGEKDEVKEAQKKSKFSQLFQGGLMVESTPAKSKITLARPRQYC